MKESVFTVNIYWLMKLHFTGQHAFPSSRKAYNTEPFSLNSTGMLPNIDSFSSFAIWEPSQLKWKTDRVTSDICIYYIIGKRKKSMNSNYYPKKSSLWLILKLKLYYNLAQLQQSKCQLIHVPSYQDGIHCPSSHIRMLVVRLASQHTIKSKFSSPH